MTAQTFQNQLAFRNSRAPLTDRPSHRGAIPVRQWGARWLGACIASLRIWRSKSRSQRSLSQMSDRELEDIGLTRCDLDRLSDARFNRDLMFRN